MPDTALATLPAEGENYSQGEVRILLELERLRGEIGRLRGDLEMIQRIVYGAAALILVAFMGSIIALALK